MAALYATATLLSVLGNLDRPQPWILEQYFPSEITFDTETIDFEMLPRRTRALAPFVSPKVAGKVMREQGSTLKQFKPAYVKPKNPVDWSVPTTRQPGERYGGSLSAGQRYDAAVARLMADQDFSITRRELWMAIEALRTGKVTVAGDGFETQEVDFGRDAALTAALTGTAEWGDAGINPMDTIEDFAGLIQTKGDGAVATDVIMEPKAFKLFRENDYVKQALDNWRQASGKMELGPTLADKNTRVAYKGTIGSFDIYTYQDTYVDEAGAVHNFLADYEVIIAGKDIEGHRCYGAIKESKIGFQPLARFPKMWSEDDPSVDYVMTQSAPLVVPARPNGSACIKVKA